MSRGRPGLTPGAVAGLWASAIATLVAAGVHTLLPTVAFPPQSIGQILIRTTPGAFNSFFIGWIGHWALRLAVIGVAVALAASGAILGRALESLGRMNQSPTSWGLLLLPAWVAGVLLYPEVPQYLPRTGFALATLPIYLAAGISGGSLYRRLSRAVPRTAIGEPATEPAAETVTRTEPRLPGNPQLSRRYFLISLGAGSAGIALGLANINELLDPGARVLRAGNVVRARRPTPRPGDELFANVEGLTSDLTSIADHYVVDEEIIDPIIDPKSWRLSVSGLVGTDLSVTYQELRSMEAIERYQTLECVSNEIGGNLISTAKWVGVPLRTILEKARVDSSHAVEVVFKASGGYSDSLPFDQSMDDTTLIAFGMNDHVLPRAHGFPARLLSLGTYGYKNPKWLTEIEVVDKPYRGFWQKRGWDKEGLLKTMSRVDVPRRGEVPNKVTIAGIAFAADRGISRVEVSTDGGRSWVDARLKTALSPYAWRLWMLEWEPTDGEHEIVVRAYDGTGAVQISTPASPFPNGASGYDNVEVIS